MSGGVDSTVCTALLVSALGPEKVVAVHIDNGFMRQGESAKVKESLEALGLRLNGRQLSLGKTRLVLIQLLPASLTL